VQENPLIGPRILTLNWPAWASRGKCQSQLFRWHSFQTLSLSNVSLIGSLSLISNIGGKTEIQISLHKLVLVFRLLQKRIYWQEIVSRFSYWTFVRGDLSRRWLRILMRQRSLWWLMML
jgi:hypothetical protein